MRESDSETEREVWLRQRRKQAYRCSLSPVVRSHREGRGPGWVPPNGEDGDDWHVVSPRRRKARRQAMQRQNWRRGEQRFRERLSAARRQSRPRLSRQVFDGSKVDYYQLRKVDWYREELDGGRGNREGLDYERDSRKHTVGRQAATQRRQRAAVGGGSSDHAAIRRGRTADGNGAMAIVRGKEIKETDNTTVQAGRREAASLRQVNPQARKFVTFYFTNFPPFLSNFYLRKGLKVCGMLEEVVIPARRNMEGKVYGFVRYSNMRDVCKLLKAVNFVCFGNFKILAKVARFDKAAAREVEKERLGEGGSKKVGEGVGKVVSGATMMVDGAKAVTKGSELVGVKGDGNSANNVIAVNGKEGATVTITDVVESMDVVRVSDVMVRVQKRKPSPNVGAFGKKDLVIRANGYITDNRGQPSIQKLVRKYKPREEDILWASKGVVAAVVNGAFVPDIENRIADEGFLDIEIMPMGADRVLICSASDVHVMSTINDAKEFFEHFFSNFVRWDKNIFPFQRGAWLRIYGIPIHAWNESFFKLCILDCVRFLRTDECSVEKERFDYARVLVATTSYEILNCSEEVLIDGEVVTVKIIEEWGFNIGENTCLFEEEDEARETQSLQEEVV